MDIHSDPVPLRIDEAGAIRVGKTRVLFVLVVNAFRQGATPEKIAHDMYTTLQLADVYAVIAYYLRHSDEVDRYIETWEAEARELRRTIEAAQAGRPDLRETLLARRAEWKERHGPTGDYLPH